MKFKSVFIFIIGAAIGAGGMYLALNEHTKQVIEKKINEELEKQDNNRKARQEEFNKRLDSLMDNVKEVKEEIKETTEEAPKPDLTAYKKVLEKVEYDKVPVIEQAKTMTDAVKEEAEELISTAKKTVEKIEASKKSAKKVKVPKKVTQDEFDSTAESERMTLYYYADGVLADDEDVIYDPAETMGATNFKNFKSTYDTVYIFNYATNLMYEIIPSNSCYVDIVGGDINE